MTLESVIEDLREVCEYGQIDNYEYDDILSQCLVIIQEVFCDITNISKFDKSLVKKSANDILEDLKRLNKK